MLDSYSAKQGIQKLKVGGPILSILEAASQSDSRQIGAILQALQSQDIDSIGGLALEAYGNSKGIPRLGVRTARGSVSIIDTSFTKISGQLSPAAPASIAGSSSICVTRTDWLTAPTSGNLYLGRGLPSYEGPISYTAITDNGTYLTITLASPTTQFHNQGESVVKAQGGNRSIGSGTVAQTAQGSVTTAVQFNTVYQYSIPDGETQIDGVSIACNVAGSMGNVPAGAISGFVGSGPFVGATVTNPSSINNGRDVETDGEYRTRIKKEQANPQRGTDQAIINSVVGLQDSLGETISAAYVDRAFQGPSQLYVDDGSGYEETSAGIGIEVLVNQAAGGETKFQTNWHQVAKAFCSSGNQAPFSLSDGSSLGVSVGGLEYSHVFSANEFLEIGAATAYEVVSSINEDSRFPVMARTINNGTGFALEAISEANEDIEVTPGIGLDSNDQFGFPVNRVYTTSLYLNDRWLSKDGSLATINSMPFGQWDQLVGPQTLEVSVDGTPTTTYTFTDTDFSGTGFSGIGKNSLAAWTEVLNASVAGVTFTELKQEGVIQATSNKGANSKAGLAITGGTLVSSGMFQAQSQTGQDRDYILDRPTGKLILSNPLAPGDRLTLGSNWTRAFLETPRLSPTSLTDSIRLWILADSRARINQTGITPGTLLTSSVVGVGPNTYQVALNTVAGANPFSNVTPGDWMVVYDYSGQTSSIPKALEKAYKVVKEVSGGGSYGVAIEKPEAKTGRYEGAFVTLLDGRVMVIGGKTGLYDSNGANPNNPGLDITNSCEIFTQGVSSGLGNWADGASLFVARAGHTATVLTSGKVLVVGGRGNDGSILYSTEIYDPIANTWTLGPVYSSSVPIVYHTATLLSSGRVLITGGLTTGGVSSGISVEYDPTTNTWLNVSTLAVPRYKHAAIRLNCHSGASDGFVLVAGGYYATGLGASVSPTVELYNPSTHTWTQKASMNSARECFSLVQASYSAPYNVIAIGSSSRASAQNGTYSIYNVTENSWGLDTAISASLAPVTISFENSRIGSLYNSAGTWTLIAPYCKGSNGQTYTLSWNGSDWVAIGNPLSVGSIFSNSREDVLVAEIGSTYGSNTSIMFFGGVDVSYGTSTIRHPYSTHEVLVAPSTWAYPSDAASSGFYLGNTSGLVFFSSETYPSYVLVPRGGNYVSSGFIAQLNSQALGCVASSYRTSALRLSTTNYSGDLLVVANSDFADLPLVSGVLVGSEKGQNGTVLSNSGAIGTPLDFTSCVIDSITQPATSDSIQDLSVVLSSQPLGTSVLMGLKTPDSSLAARSSNWKGYRATTATTTLLGQSGGLWVNQLGLRTKSDSKLASGQPVVLCSPLHIGPYDDFNVTVDKDTVTGQFNIQMARQVKAAPASSYGSTITLTESSGTSLTSTFGLEYSFNDFAVYMKARAKSHSTDTTKSALWRYYRHGSDGQSFAVRYSYPSGPNSSLSVTINHNQDTLDLVGVSRSTIDINLGSGALRTGATLLSSTRLGFACSEVPGYVTGSTFTSYLIAGYAVASYSRVGPTGGMTKLTLTVPSGLSFTGIHVGDTLYFDAVNPGTTTLYSGPFTVAQVDDPDGSGNFNVYVPDGILCQAGAPPLSGSNPGTVSIDSTAKVRFSNQILVNDLVRLTNTFTGSNATTANKYTNTTMRVTSLDPGFQWLECSFSNLNGATNAQPPVYAQLAVPAQLQVFAGPSQNVTSIVGAVNSSTNCPITGTVLGDGSGVINKSSWDEANTQAFSYQLKDGLNFVQRTIPPDISTGNIQLLLKAGVDSSLITNSDWLNEDIRLAPQTAENVVSWLNTPTVTGLWSRAEIVSTVNGNIQITSLNLGSDSGVEILGGLANENLASVYGSMYVNNPQPGSLASALVTIKTPSSNGFVGGRWVEIQNDNPLPKSGIIGFQLGTAITSTIPATNTWLTPAPLYNVNPYLRGDSIVEIQGLGRYVLVSMDLGSFVFSIIDLTGYLHIENPTSSHARLPNTSLANQGTFPIVAANVVNGRIQVWIENSSAIEESSYANCHFREFDSLTVGDTITIESTDFGINNRGTFTITSVGFNGSSYYFTTDRPPQLISNPVVFTSTNLPLILEGSVRKATKQLISVSPNQTDGTYSDLKFIDTKGIKTIGQAVGSIIRALDKLDFGLGFNAGSDAYRYNTGLVGAASEQVYGTTQDTSQNTGFISNGASILTSGPRVKRVQVSLAVRATSQTQSIIDQVKTAVAAFINGLAMGTQIAFSDIVEAAKVPGVTSVSIVSPNYNSGNDVIALAAYEKPMVLSVDNDLSVVFIGT